MYKGTPYLNKKIKVCEEKRSMSYHMSNLHHVRARTSSLQHSSWVHINKKKGEMQREIRYTQIERQNRILLSKISSIMGKYQNKTQSQRKIANKSLNSQFRKRQLQNIEVENAKLLKRLYQKKSEYDVEKFKEIWKKQKYVIKNLSNYPFIIKDKKSKRGSLSEIAHRQPKTNTIQLCRLRTIDGVNFLITLKMNQHKLQIIGDTKQKNEVKVIQIQRKSAIQFIERECDGKIQQIFELLRFNTTNQVLYLVPKDIAFNDVHEYLIHAGENSTNKKLTENPEFVLPNEQNQQFNLHHPNLNQEQLNFQNGQRENSHIVTPKQINNESIEKEQESRAETYRNKIQEKENNDNKQQQTIPNKKENNIPNQQQKQILIKNQENDNNQLIELQQKKCSKIRENHNLFQDHQEQQYGELVNQESHKQLKISQQGLQNDKSHTLVKDDERKQINKQTCNNLLKRESFSHKNIQNNSSQHQINHQAMEQLAKPKQNQQLPSNSTEKQNKNEEQLKKQVCSPLSIQQKQKNSEEDQQFMLT